MAFQAVVLRRSCLKHWRVMVMYNYAHVEHVQHQFGCNEKWVPNIGCLLDYVMSITLQPEDGAARVHVRRLC